MRFTLQEADALRKRICDEVQNLGNSPKSAEVIQDLHEYNAQSRINRLSPEILCNIFKFFIRDAFTKEPDWKDRDTNTAGYIRHWIHITFVCSNWRNVALEFTELWAVHNLVNNHWTKEILRRSKGAELYVIMEYGPDTRESATQSLDSFQLCLGHKDRIKEIDLTLTVDTILPWMSYSFPALQTLKIRLGTPFNAGPLQPLPESFLGGAASKSLRSITLINCFLPWSSPLISQQILKIDIYCFMSHDGPWQGSVSDMMTALRRAPNIEELSMAWHPFPAPGTCDVNQYSVALKQMRFLALRNTQITSICNILGLVTLPSTARLAIETICPDPGSDIEQKTYKDLFPLISSVLSAPTGMDVLLWSNEIHFRVWDGNTASQNPKGFLKIMQPDFNEDPPSKVAEDFYQCIGLVDLKTLHLSGTDFTVEHIRQNFSQLLGLQELIMDNNVIKLFIMVHLDYFKEIGGDQTQEHQSFAQNIPFPLLMSLTIVKYKLAEDDTELIRALRLRSDSGKQISHLFLKDGQVRRSQFEELRQTVGKLKRL